MLVMKSGEKPNLENYSVFFETLRVHRKIKSDFMKVKLCNSIVDEPRGILC
jgi:hypothetical protein